MDAAAFADLLAAVPAALMVTDGAGQCTHASERFSALCRRDPKGGGWIEAVSPDDRSLVAGAVARAAALGIASTVRCRVGGERWVELELAPRLDASGAAVGAVAVATVDVDAPLLVTIEERTDPLTGAANREGVLAHLEVLLRPDDEPAAVPRSVGVLLVDLDGFAEVNEAMGRDAGDELLVAVMGRLRGTVRFGDLVGRTDADRFVVVTEQEGDPRAAELVAARVLMLFVRSFRLHAGSVRITASVGVAVGDATTDGPALLAQAGAATLAAKTAGGACWRRIDGLRLVQ